MKQVTLNIPDTKLKFFMQLFKELGLEVVDEGITILLEQQQEVEIEEGIQQADNGDLIEHKEARKRIDNFFKKKN
jgi:ssDNA-specific exonuclease RecJ